MSVRGPWSFCSSTEPIPADQVGCPCPANGPAALGTLLPFVHLLFRSRALPQIPTSTFVFGRLGPRRVRRPRCLNSNFTCAPAVALLWLRAIICSTPACRSASRRGNVSASAVATPVAARPFSLPNRPLHPRLPCWPSSCHDPILGSATSRFIFSTRSSWECDRFWPARPSSAVSSSANVRYIATLHA